MTSLKISWQVDWGMTAQFSGENADVYARFIEGVLVSDFKEPEWCETVLQDIAKVENGELPEAQWEGNSWQVDIRKDRVLISFQTEPTHESDFPLKDFKQCLSTWKEFLMLPSKIEQEILVRLDS